MDELSRWCEIDGHKWNIYVMSYGLVLGPKTIHTTYKCAYCLAEDATIYTPKDTDYKHFLPLYGETLFL